VARAVNSDGTQAFIVRTTPGGRKLTVQRIAFDRAAVSVVLDRCGVTK
jgi:hypothetical protein